VEKFSEGKAEAAEGGISAGDGENDYADDNNGGNGMKRKYGSNQSVQSPDPACLCQELGVLFVDEHTAGSPDHADEPFHDHHAIEGAASGAFRFFRAGDDRALGTVKTADNATGDCNEEHGNNGLLFGVLRKVGENIAEVDVVECGKMRNEADQDSDAGKNQHSAENGVDAPDDFINGKKVLIK
jgi:hypothetical protein